MGTSIQIAVLFICFACLGCADVHGQAVGVADSGVPAKEWAKTEEPKKYRFDKRGAIVYCQTDDYQLKCDVYVPEGDGPFPAVLAIHGGAWRSGSKIHMLRHAWALAKRGYVVMAINYRHAPSHKFPAQIHDCKQAVRWLRMNANQFKVDSDRIGAFGYSAGGHLVSLLATTDKKDGLEGTPHNGTSDQSTRISAAVIGGAPCEFSWLNDQSIALAYWTGGTKQKKPEVYQRASATSYVDSMDCPTFFYWGERDLLVPGSSSEKLHESLKNQGIVTEYLLLKGKGHFGAFSDFNSFNRCIDFLDQQLKKGK